MSAGEIIVLVICWVGSVCAGYWLGFDDGYEAHRWEDEEDEYL